MKSRNKATSGHTAAPGGVTRVAAYIRVSTDEQRVSGLGLKDQLHRTRAMATVKGWPEPAVYKDEGISGTKDVDKRPGLAALMADVAGGSVDAVIVLDLSRLARKTRLVLDLVEDLTAHGVSLISCKEALDTTTPQGQFVLTLFAALAQLERDQIAQRTKGALDALRRDGKAQGGRLPYGYLRADDDVAIDELAAGVVREIFDLRRGGWTYRAIATHLNEHDIAPPRGGAQWYASSVYEVMLNEAAYRGGDRGPSYPSWPVILEGLAA